MSKVVLFLISVISVISVVNCDRFLVVFPLFSPSHHFLGQRLVEKLADEGHNVTYITCFETNYKPKKGELHTIVLEEIRRIGEGFRQNLFKMSGESRFLMHFRMNYMGNGMLESILRDENIQNLLNSNEKFDVVIIEQFLIDGLKYFAHHFNGHLVLFSTIGTNAWIDTLVGNPSQVAYTSEIGYHNYYKSFWSRVYNFLLYCSIRLNVEFMVFPKQDRIIKKQFPNAPNLENYVYNTSLVLLNSHISISQSVPQVPNMIDIGGFHVKPPKKLPDDLQKFLDEDKEGVIYFSLGSNLRSSELSIEKRDALLNVFAKRKEKILWKWETDELPGKPSNVFLKKWFPQQDILAHPNVKLFITHGGLLSTTETVYHGVPILAIPVFGDQKLNAERAEKEGYALSIEFSDLDEETFGRKLNEILSNPKYRENVKRISKIFHDRPQKPLDTAVYWLEYVIRHNGAKHLRVAGLELSWYQNASLDVLTFIFLVFVLTIYIIYVIINSFCSKISKKTKQKKS